MLKYILLVTVAVYYAAATRNLKQKVIQFPDEFKVDIYKAIDKCAGSIEQAAKFMDVVQSGKYVEDDEFKAFVYCGYKTTGYLNEDGRLNIEKALPLFPEPEVMLKVFNLCDEKRGKTPEETNFEFFKCFQTTSPYLIAAS